MLKTSPADHALFQSSQLGSALLFITQNHGLKTHDRAHHFFWMEEEGGSLCKSVDRMGLAGIWVPLPSWVRLVGW
jgi:hypothetical protein